MNLIFLFSFLSTRHESRKEYKQNENIEFDAVARSRQETQEVVLDNSYEDLESFEREAYELKKTTLEKTL